METIGWAIKNMWNGERVRRAGWNGKGMWLAISPGVTDNPTEKFWSPAIRAFGHKSGVAAITVAPYVVMYTAQGEIVPWLCSQADLLASDWELA